ncbi:MAG TPA: hypothetical protein VFL55_05570 [Acetobacteraceae bacterium]|nr:hypothetical protein [Acetobacteraceae bacterium]
MITLLTTAADTIWWWRTEGGAVMQIGSACTLVSYSPSQAFLVSWNQNSDETIGLQDERFKFDNEQFTVAVRINGSALSGNLTGSGNGNMLTVPVSPIDSLLPRAAEVQVQLANAHTDSAVTVPVNTAKMPTLLAAVAKCRAATLGQPPPRDGTPSQ